MTQVLYGMSAMTFNVHQLLHLAKSVQQLGPLWSHSTLIFESGNGLLLKLVSDDNGVPLQILERFVMQVELKRIVGKLEPSAETVAFCSSIGGKMNDRSTHVLGKSRMRTSFNSAEQDAFQLKLGSVPHLAVEYERISIEGQQVHSVNYLRPKKTNNSVLITKCGAHCSMERVYELSDGQQVLSCHKLVCRSLTKVPHLLKGFFTRPDIRMLTTGEVDRLCVCLHENDKCMLRLDYPQYV